MLSLFIESFFIEPFDMFSLDIVSFFMSSAKATGARIRPAVISVEKSVLFRIGYTPVDGRCTFSAITTLKHILISSRCRKLAFGSRFCENDRAGPSGMKEWVCERDVFLKNESRPLL